MVHVSELLALGALCLASQCAAAVRVNTWSTCALDATPDGFPSLTAQCATAVVPLCAGGLCSDPDGQTINLYLKRIVANSNGSGAAPMRNVWVVPDRSDYVLPTDVDTQLQLIYRQLGGDASVYTLDQRGTGRSSQIVCDTSTSLDASAVQRCSQALSVVLGNNLVAFSLTSAAYDLVSLITLLHAKTEVFVYGLGYGSLVVERLLHFGIADVKGYILDGAATTSGGKKSSFAYISKADDEFGQVGDAFLALCEKDATCSSKFSAKSVTQVLDKVLASLDSAQVADDSNCASVFTPAPAMPSSSSSSTAVAAVDPASYKLRRALAQLMHNVTERAFIPVVVYRLGRCNAADRSVLTRLFTRLLARESRLKAKKEVVSDLIAFSELWESPSAMETKLSARFTEAAISSGRIYDQLRRYCLFTSDTSDACVEIGAAPNASARGANATRLAYTRDAYWNTAATIPATSSVLLLSGKLDGQAPTKYAQDLKDALKGSAKELLTFDASTHNVLTSSRLSDGSSCGLAILESYITSSGNLNKYDTSCIDKLPSLSFALSKTASAAVLGTVDAYDGELVPTAGATNGSANSSSNSTDGSSAPSAGSGSSDLERENASLRRVIRRYRVAFIIVVAMLLVMLVVFALILLRWWREKQYRDEQAGLEELRLEQATDYNELAQAERLRKLHMASTINVRSGSSEEDWFAAGSQCLLPLSTDSRDIGPTPPLSGADSFLDWNFRSHPRGDHEASLPPEIQPPPFSDWTYSSSNHLRI